MLKLDRSGLNEYPVWLFNELKKIGFTQDEPFRHTKMRVWRLPPMMVMFNEDPGMKMDGQDWWVTITIRSSTATLSLMMRKPHVDKVVCKVKEMNSLTILNG